MGSVHIIRVETNLLSYLGTVQCIKSIFRKFVQISRYSKAQDIMNELEKQCFYA